LEQKPLELSAGYGKTIDWLSEGVVNPVFNEGICGASWAFVTADAVASAYKIKEGDLYELSAQQLISCAGANYYNEGCNGGNTYTSMLYTTSNPLELNTDYPYVQRNSLTVRDCAYNQLNGKVSA